MLDIVRNVQCVCVCVFVFEMRSACTFMTKQPKNAVYFSLCVDTLFAHISAFMFICVSLA